MNHRGHDWLSDSTATCNRHSKTDGDVPLHSLPRNTTLTVCQARADMVAVQTDLATF
jgi:hypothetical protein